MASKKAPRRSDRLKQFVEDISFQPARRYVDIQRERGRIFTVDKVDVDLDQLVSRTFLCDQHRCIHWTPHTKQKDARPIIDNSCCSRYSVPVTDLDRKKLLQILPLVKKRLAKDHPLNQGEIPFEIDDDDFSFVLSENGAGVCQFVQYIEGKSFCAIHRTCSEEKLPVWEYKPLSCSLWPLALVDYERDGEARYLLTVYSNATSGLFDEKEDASENDESHFACMIDQDPKYDPLYKSMQGIIEHVLGPEFFQKLDRHAAKISR